MTGWLVAGVAGWCAGAPLIAVLTGRVLSRRTADSTPVDELLRVPASWSIARPDTAAA